MYSYHALINALSAHMIDMNLDTIFYTHTEHSPTKTILHKVLYGNTHTHAHAHTHTHAHAHTRTRARTHAHTHTHTHTHTHAYTHAETEGERQTQTDGDKQAGRQTGR